MRMTKRGFLGLLGGGVVAGPKAIPKAAESILPGVLHTTGVSLLNPLSEDGPMGLTDAAMPASSWGSKTWAVKELAKWAIKTAEDWDKERSEFDIHRFTPNIHALKSVSLGHKMKMAQDIAFDRWKERQYDFLMKRSMGLDDE